MSVLRLSMQFAAFIMLFIFPACTSTKFSSDWKDETYEEHPRKILVIIEHNNPDTRKIFEDELVKALKERAVDAVVSYIVIPDSHRYNKDAIATQANTVGADTVLISKTLRSKIVKSTGQSIGEYRYLYIDTQTEVYDMKSNRLVLTVSATTRMPSGEQSVKEIQSFIKDLVKELSQQGLI